MSAFFLRLAILKGTVNVVSQHVAKAFKDSAPGCGDAWVLGFRVQGLGFRV